MMRGIGRVAVAAILGGILSACSTTTGTRVYLTESSLSKIRTLGVVVRTNAQFSVRISQEKGADPSVVAAGAAGGALGVLLAASIDSGAKSAHDETVLRRVRPWVGEFDCRQQIRDGLVRRLQEAAVFDSIVALPPSSYRAWRAAAVDAVLEATIAQWGLVICDVNSPNQKLQVCLDVHERLIDLATGKDIWRRQDLHFDSDCHSLEEFEDRPGLLRAVLQRAVDDLTERIVNELRYPQLQTPGNQR